ncbi:MAG: M28 family peptidase [Firmicutes bacterium]|nr:M28 family peptidase [Bacillota bacterium]
MKKKNLIIASAVGLASLLLSLFILYTPVPSNDAGGFSAVKAASYISELSRDPHALSDAEAHEAVHDYLKSQLETFVGAGNVQEMNYTAAEVGPDCDYPISNLLATIPGTSDTGVLLVAHYDSRGYIGRAGELGRSYGAADDGYGIATLLEIARLYGSRTLSNSIYILMTDGEEVGLYGARMAARETALMAKIGFVINVEARGVQGAAYMFETSTKNQKVIDFYKNAQMPVSYSLATAVYTVMPNMTDFTEFLAIGKQGINFAVLDGLYYYHTPMDNYTNINLSSIQHYGEQIVPLIEEFATHTQYADINYFVGTQNQVFFNLLPGVFVAYTETLAITMNIILIVLFIGLIVFIVLKKQVRPLQILLQFGILLGAIVVAVLVGLYASKLIAFLGRVPWSVTYVRMQGTELPTLLIMLAAVVGFGFLVKKFLKTREDKIAMMLAGIGLNLILATATGFILSGASFLFFIPALVGLVSLLLDEFVKNKIVKHVAFSQNIFWNILIIVPLLFSLFLALTVGGLLALLLILTLFISIMVPSVFLQLEI